MSDFEEFAECLSDATKQLFSDIEDAWKDLRGTVTVEYPARRRRGILPGGREKFYGILTGTQIISLNEDAMKADKDIEKKFGSFAWLANGLPEESEEEQEEAAE